MFIDIFLNVLKDIWPMIFIFSVILVSCRVFYLITNNEKVVFYKEILMFCFIIYILLLYYIVTFQDNNYGTNNFIPFKEIFRYSINSKYFFKNVIGNIILFIPFGIFVTYYMNNKKFIITFILSLIVSAAIEFAQNAIGRTVDIDDVILNIIGGLLGYFIFKIIGIFSNKLPSFFKSQLFLDSFCLILIIVLVYLAYKVNFWRFLSWIILM